MFNKKILVTYDEYYASAIKGLGIPTTDIQDFIKNPNEFSLVLFTGGSDVSPEFYNNSSPKYCMCDINRDLTEHKVFEHAMTNGVRTLGICRGLQFINVKAGGELFHHVEGHRFGNHLVETKSQTNFLVNSYHHQMVILPKDAYMIAYSMERLSNIYRGDYDLPITPFPDFEIEAAIYPGFESAGVQWHPEAMPENSKGYLFFYNLAKKMIEIDDFNIITDYYRNINSKALYNQLNPGCRLIST